MFASVPRTVFAALLAAATAGCGATPPMRPTANALVGRCEPDLSQHLDVMEPEAPGELVDSDCDTVPDAQDACPEAVGVPQPLASRAGCPLDVLDVGVEPERQR